MHESSTYDIAIIGGGLAGLCMGIQSAAAGFSVVLFEKEVYPFHKVCGEYISMESLPFLQRLGLDTDQLKLPVIKKLLLTDVQGDEYRFALPLGGFGISRYVLDSTLFNIAVSKGVKAVTNCKVHDVTFQDEMHFVENNAHPCTAKIVVGSFGKKSNLDVKWKRPFTRMERGGKNYVGIKYHVRYEHPHDEIALHNFKDGYCGMSKIEDDKSCLCYLTTAAQLQAAGNSIRKLEEDVLYQNPRLKSIFSSATFLYNEPLAISQISFAAKSLVHDHVLLAGDAAGLITPLCGNGMSMAMHASDILFHIVRKFLANEISRSEMEAEYNQQWSKQFKQRLFVGRTVQNFFGSPVTTRLFLKTMNSLPALSRSLIRATHGKSF
jgi:flavin-dependent dehydrogenase